ncbi:MAG: TRAP transporter small permease [Rhodospirillales bacterium]|jgi:TRAP-type C4-dicarboxylate transport system permease small subunit|nr:TRAP transporter small permease [Rhodospirillales bacterium]
MVARLLRAVALLGGFGLLGLLALTVVAVVMRKIFGSHLIGIFDISQVTLIFIVSSGMAHCGITRGHMAVDMFSDMFPPRLQNLLNGVINLVTAGLLAFMAWVTVFRAFDAQELNEATMMIFIPHFPFLLLVAAGLALYALACLLLAAGYEVDGPDAVD